MEITMAQDHRILHNRQRLDYTCTNRRFRTDINKGERHGQHSRNRGSVFDRPLADHDGYSLWMEHVIDESGHEYYWLMWYDPAGKPTIPLSGILSREDIANIQRLFVNFI